MEVKESGRPTRPMGKFRDGRQRFDAGVEFIWRVRRKLGYTGQGDNRTPYYSEIGSPVDKDSFVSPSAVRRLWNAEFIERADGGRPPVVDSTDADLPEGSEGSEDEQDEAQGGEGETETEPAETDEPETEDTEAPEVPEVPGVSYEAIGAGWYLVKHGETEEKVHGKKALDAYLQSLVEG